jgi:5-methylcytosine-specific restriction endonuclease McrA
MATCQRCGKSDPEARFTKRWTKTCVACVSPTLGAEKTYPALPGESEADRLRRLSRARVARWKDIHPEQAAQQSVAGQRRWRARHPEQAAARDLAQYERRRGVILQQRKDRYASNPEHAAKMRAYGRAWNAKNPAQKCLLSANRRSALLGRPGRYSKEEWDSRLAEFGHACAYCLRTNIRLVVEHVLPVSRGGDSAIDNVVPACARCNSAKGARGVLSMLRMCA